MRIAFIACSKRKKEVPAKAEDLYQGNLFKKSLRLAKLEKFPKIFILSAKYGVLDLNQRIEPYDLTLLNQNKSERQNWSNRVVNQLKEKGISAADEFHYFAGSVYYEFLPPGKIRFHGASMGEIDNHLQKQIDRLHKKGFGLFR